MSIIEETLKAIGNKQNSTGPDHHNTTTHPTGSNVSMKQKPRTRPFVMIIIVLIFLGILAYMALERYQKKLKTKSNIYNYEISYLESELSSSKEDEEVLESLEFSNKLHEADKKPNLVKKQLRIASEQMPQQHVLDDQGPKSFDEDIIKKNSDPVITTGFVDTNDQVIESLKQNNREGDTHTVEIAGAAESKRVVEHVSNKSVDQTDADGSDSKDIVLENMRLQSDGKTGSVEQEVLHYESPDNLTGKPLQEQYLYAEHSDPDLKQKTNTMFSSDNYKEAGHSSDKNVSLTVEKEYSVDTQLNHAKGLIDIGSHKEAIKVLSHVIDSSTGNWNAYLLNGVAYLSLAELNNAEKYLDMGLSINTKSPQLWLMRAIVEQQKGNHSFALQILQQAERIAPRMPEVQLNIGYSYDAIGNKKFSAKAYDSFLKLTEGKPEYMTVRHKVLERLQDFK